MNHPLPIDTKVVFKYHETMNKSTTSLVHSDGKLGYKSERATFGLPNTQATTTLKAFIFMKGAKFYPKIERNTTALFIIIDGNVVVDSKEM